MKMFTTMVRGMLLGIVLLTGLSMQAQDEVTLTVNSKWLSNDTIVALFEPRSYESYTTYIKGNKFSFTVKLPKGGSVYILKVGDAATDWDDKMTMIYLEPGKVDIKGGTSFKDATYSGDAFAKEFRYVWDNFGDLSPMMKPLKGLKEKLTKAQTVGDEDAALALMNEITLINAKRDAVANAWVKENSNSGVSAFVATVYLNKTKKDFPARMALLQSLGDHAKKTRIYKIAVDPLFEPNKSLPSLGAAAPDKFAIGSIAPDFTSLDADGKFVSLSDFKGKYVFIDFWASWCMPCKIQNPYYVAANNKYKDKNFVLLGVSIDSQRAAWLNAIAAEGLNWLQLSTLKANEEPAAKIYDVSSIPRNFLIGPDGKIVAKQLMGEAIEKTLSELIK